MKANNTEFEENLKKLGDLYERGKDLCNSLLPVPSTKQDMDYWNELRNVLREMRDLAAVQMRHKHDIVEN